MSPAGLSPLRRGEVTGWTLEPSPVKVDIGVVFPEFSWNDVISC